MTDVIYPLAGKKVWVTGHRGLVGSALVRRLAGEDCDVLTVGRDQLDLRDQAAVFRWMADARPDAVFLAAALVGGIAANDSASAQFLYDNLAIESNVIEGARRAGAEKLLFLGSSCIYPKYAEQPIREDALLSGPLEPTNQWYSVAKIAGLKLAEAFRQEYGSDFISAMPPNLYGPGDNFDLVAAHVASALLRKFHAAKVEGRDAVVVWGSGTPLREFMYVDDCADALVFLMQHYSAAQHINVGTGEEVSILALAELIAEIVGFDGAITLDGTKPDGTPRKLLDNTKLSNLGWTPRTTLRDGLAETYRWFLGAGAYRGR